MKNKDTAIREAMRLNIIANRKRMNLRQKDLADLMGVKKNTVSSWEQGLSSPDIDTRRQCAYFTAFLAIY